MLGFFLASNQKKTLTSDWQLGKKKKKKKGIDRGR